MKKLIATPLDAYTQFIQSWKTKPLETYFDYLYRFYTQGKLFWCPELKPVLNTLINKIQNHPKAKLNQNKAHCSSLVFKLMEVKGQGCPYTKTLEIIQKSLETYDILEGRSKMKFDTTPDLRITVEEDDYYDAYSHIRTPKLPHFKFPCHSALSKKDLIFCHPLFSPLGCQFEPISYDGLPKDLFTSGVFWIHDKTHAFAINIAYRSYEPPGFFRAAPRDNKIDKAISFFEELYRTKLFCDEIKAHIEKLDDGPLKDHAIDYLFEDGHEGIGGYQTPFDWTHLKKELKKKKWYKRSNGIHKKFLSHLAEVMKTHEEKWTREKVRQIMPMDKIRQILALKFFD